MPSFRHEQPDPLEQKLDGLERLSTVYSDAILAVSTGDVETAAEGVEGAGVILEELDAWEKTAQESSEPDGVGKTQQRLQAKARAVLDLHSRLLDALRQERNQVSRKQKSLSQGRRHLESLQPEGRPGSILDSHA